MEASITRGRIAVQSFLAQLPLFQAMAPAELDRIALGATEMHVPRGEVVFRRGDTCDGFHVVIYGQVKLAFVSEQGTEKVVELVGAGHSFGEAVMFMNKPYIVTAQALEDSLLVHVSRDTVLDELRREPDFACKMLAGLSWRMHGLMSDMESYSMRSGTQRVIGYLLKDDGTVDGEHLRLPVTKAIIASRLNLTPEHFSRILTELCAHDLIAVRGRNITILNIDGLRQYAG